jgi:hypothetical protein
MTDDPPRPTPEGQMIRRVRSLSIPKLTIPAAAARIGLSAEQWGYVERGYYPARDGNPPRPFSPPAATLAKMAHALRITPERLETEGQRPDAAEILAEILRQQHEAEPSAADRDWRPEPGPDAYFSAEESATAEPHVAELRARYESLRRVGIADPNGSDMFENWRTDPAEAGYAAAWDATARMTVARDEARHLSQILWSVALYRVRREARLHEENNPGQQASA